MPLIPKPDPTPLWGNAAAGGDLVDPSTGQKNTGWIGSQIPPHETFNWFQNYVQKGVLNWMQNGLPIWDAADTYPVGAFIRDAGDGNYYYATGTTTVGLAPHLDLTHWLNPFGSVMTSNYTGNPVGVEAPDTGPVLGGAPIVLVPPSGATVQPLKALADWVAFTSAQLNVPSVHWGDGSDGALVVPSGTTTITSPKNYTDVTVQAGGILVIRNSVVRVRGLLDVDAAGLVHCDGDSSIAGSGLSGFGTDTVPVSPVFSLSIGGGGSGGFGPAHNLGGGPLFVAVPGLGFTIGGSAAGGAGGTGVTNSGVGTGSGGAGGQAGISVPSPFPTSSVYNPGFAVGRTSVGGAQEQINTLDPTRIIPVVSLVALRGGGGGGGGAGAGGPSGGDTNAVNTNPNGYGWTTGGPGAGGAGGGVMILFARTANLRAVNVIRAKGGNGSAGTNNSVHPGDAQGGGGGGGGGRVHFYFGSNAGSALTTGCVAGGSGGAGVNGGTAGAAGATGVLQYIQLPM